MWLYRMIKNIGISYKRKISFPNCGIKDEKAFGKMGAAHIDNRSKVWENENLSKKSRPF